MRIYTILENVRIAYIFFHFFAYGQTKVKSTRTISFSNGFHCSFRGAQYAASVLACIREVSARYEEFSGGRGLGGRKLFVIRLPSCCNILEAQILFPLKSALLIPSVTKGVWP